MTGEENLGVDDMAVADTGVVGVAAQLGLQAPWPDSESHWSEIQDFHSWGLKDTAVINDPVEPAFEDKYKAQHSPPMNKIPSYGRQNSLHKIITAHYSKPNQSEQRQSRYYSSEVDPYSSNSGAEKPIDVIIPKYYPTNKETKTNYSPPSYATKPAQSGPSQYYHAFPPVPLEAYAPRPERKAEPQSPPPAHQPQPLFKPTPPQLFKNLPVQQGYQPRNPVHPDHYKPPIQVNKRGSRTQQLLPGFYLPRSSYQQVNYPMRDSRTPGPGGRGIRPGAGARFQASNFPNNPSSSLYSGKTSMVSGDPFLPGDKLEIEEDFTSFGHVNNQHPQTNNDFGANPFENLGEEFAFSMEDDIPYDEHRNAEDDFNSFDFGIEKDSENGFAKYDNDEFDFDRFTSERTTTERFEEPNTEKYDSLEKKGKDKNSDDYKKIPEEFMDFMKYKKRYHNNNKYSDDEENHEFDYKDSENEFSKSQSDIQ